MPAPGFSRLRQNQRRRTAGFVLIALAVVGLMVAVDVGSLLLQVGCGILQILGSILLLTGAETSVADDFIKIGFTTIPKDRITRVDMEDDSMCVHWTGKKGVTRSYLFRRGPYHPDDWKLLMDHLAALGVSRFDERGFQPVKY